MPGSWKVSDGSSPGPLELLLPPVLLDAPSKVWDSVGSAVGDVSRCAPKPGPGADVGVRPARLAGAGLVCWGELGAAAGELEPCKKDMETEQKAEEVQKSTFFALFISNPTWC